MSEHEKKNPAEGDGQRPKGEPLPKEPDPGKHGRKDENKKDGK